MADDGPRLVRPVPRRPFEHSLTNASSPSPSEQDADDSPLAGHSPESLFSSAKFLNPSNSQDSGASLSRPQSFLNLTSSTLMGIYSGAASGSHRVFSDETELNTPWGTGARTPIKRPSIDEATFRLMNERAHMPRRGSSFAMEKKHPQPFTVAGALSLVSRGVVLYLLGLGYGALVSRLHNVQQQHSPQMPDESIMNPRSNWRHMTFWGFAGVALGSLLPWLDQVWEDTFGVNRNGDPGDEEVISEDGTSPSTDWALVMRAIGAFVGIVFAIVS